VLSDVELCTHPPYTVSRVGRLSVNSHDPGAMPNLFRSDWRISFEIGKNPPRSVCCWPSLDRMYLMNSARSGSTDWFGFRFR
jgi:hypothetical protein